MSQSQNPTQPPPAQGVRLQWEAVPIHIQMAVEQWLGSPIVSAISQATGFSPGVAARLRTGDNRGVFVKAATTSPNPGVPAIHRREAHITSLIPVVAPVPRLLWFYEDVSTDWVVLLFELIDGHTPFQPWQHDEFDRVLNALTMLAEMLTPSPLPIGTVGTASEAFSQHIYGWRKFLDEQRSLINELDPWAARHLELLIQLEADAPAAVVGDTLLNFDVRADNILLTPDRVWFVDWPLACTGAAWVDVVCFAPSVAMQGGPSPEQIIALSPACRTAEPPAITATIAAAAGFFVFNSLQSPPPGLPTLRAFQRAQGIVACNWLAQRIASDK
jgi:hypothetical protein